MRMVQTRAPPRHGAAWRGAARRRAGAPRGRRRRGGAPAPPRAAARHPAAPPRRRAPRHATPRRPRAAARRGAPPRAAFFLLGWERMRMYTDHPPLGAQKILGQDQCNPSISIFLLIAYCTIGVRRTQDGSRDPIRTHAPGQAAEVEEYADVRRPTQPRPD